MVNKQRLTGLTAAEVIERRENGLSNVSSQKVGKSVKEIVISNTFTYFNFIFLIITVLLCIVGSFRNLTFLPIVIGNTLVGIVQEIRAKKTIDKMNLLNAPHAVAVRDGQRIKLPESRRSPAFFVISSSSPVSSASFTVTLPLSTLASAQI